MPPRLLAALSLLALAAGSAQAQTPSTVTLTASHLTLGDGTTPLPAGDQVCFVTTDASDNPASYRVGAASGLSTASGYGQTCATLTAAGTLPSGVSVLNSAASWPQNACLRITEQDPVNGEISRLVCVQTGTAAALATWCSISGSTETCNLDAYPQPSAALAIGFPIYATLTGTNVFTGLITFATGQTFPGAATLAAANQTFTGNMAVSGNINSASAPGSVFASNRGWTSLNLLGSTTHTAANADCGPATLPAGDVAVTVTLPAPGTLSTPCAMYFSAAADYPATLTSASANITSPAAALQTTFTIPAGTGAEVLAFSTGYLVTNNPVAGMLANMHTWTGQQTFAGGIAVTGPFALGTTSPTSAMAYPAALALNGNCDGSGCPSIFPTFPGLTIYGDSGACGFSQAFGQTLTSPYWSANGFAWLLAQDLGGVYTNQCQSGDTATDLVREHLYPTLAPTDQRNPTTIIEDGGNEAHQCTSYPTCTVSFILTEAAAIAWAAIPQSYKVLGQSSAITKTGTWTADNFASLGNYAGVGMTPAAQPAITGIALQTTTLTGSPQVAIPITTTVANQSVYCGWRVFTTSITGGWSSGSARFGIDSSSATTDTWSGLLNYTSLNGTADSIYLKQYSIATAGSHTLYVTPTTAPFSFAWCGTVPQTLYQAGQPRVLASGVWKETAPSGASDANTGAYDTAVQNVVTAFAADGMRVTFAPVRSYLITSTDLSADGLHPNILGYQHVRDAFEFALVQAIRTQGIF